MTAHSSDRPPPSPKPSLAHRPLRVHTQQQRATRPMAGCRDDDEMICFALAYEIFAAVFLVHYCLITQGISYGTMQWNPSVTVNAEGF